MIDVQLKLIEALGNFTSYPMDNRSQQIDADCCKLLEALMDNFNPTEIMK